MGDGIKVEFSRHALHRFGILTPWCLDKFFPVGLDANVAKCFEGHVVFSGHTDIPHFSLALDIALILPNFSNIFLQCGNSHCMLSTQLEDLELEFSLGVHGCRYLTDIYVTGHIIICYHSFMS